MNTSPLQVTNYPALTSVLTGRRSKSQTILAKIMPYPDKPDPDNRVTLFFKVTMIQQCSLIIIVKNCKFPMGGMVSHCLVMFYSLIEYTHSLLSTCE